MPSRILREGILTSDRVNSLTPPAEVFYRRLMSVVDDYGRFDGRLGLIRTSCFPLRVDTVREADISRWIAECVMAGLIVLYAVGGKAYLEMQDFKQQQRAKSKFPDPVEGQPITDAEHLKTSAKQPLTGVHLGVFGVGVVSEVVSGVVVGSAPPSAPPPQAVVPVVKPARAPKPAKPNEEPPVTNATWEAYAEAYERRYKAPPLRNAKVNGQIKQIVERMGADVAPAVAAFYLTHQNLLFTRSKHPIDLLLSRAETIHTDWLTSVRDEQPQDAGETAWQRSAREKVEKFTGGIASRKNPAAMEEQHDQALAVGVGR